MYDMVTFRPDISYAEAQRQEQWQKRMVQNSAVVGAAAIAGAVGIFALKAAQPWLQRR